MFYDMNSKSQAISRKLAFSGGLSDKSFENRNLAKEFNYNPKTFWKKTPNARVVIVDESIIAAATKELIAGLFLNKNAEEILSLALDLSFYAKRSSSERTFLYSEVTTFIEIASLVKNNTTDTTQVIVNLDLPRWFDKLVEKYPMRSLELEFIDFLSKPTNKREISFLGPWLATILLRLYKSHPSDVTQKIIKLFNHDVVINEVRSFRWKEIFSKDLEFVLKRFPKARLLESKRKALFIAMIETSYRVNNDEDKTIYNLLNFTALQSLNFGGMMLITMVDRFLEDRPILKKADIIEVTQTPETAKSWNTYYEFWRFFDSMSEEVKYFTKFAREIDLDSFEKLSYAKNTKLCNYLAVIIDVGRKDVLYSESNYGPAYKRLISNRLNVELLTNDDFRFCTNAAEDLYIKECTPKNTRSGLLIAQSYQKRAQEHQKLADEASKTALFEQQRADKFRRIAEWYRRKYEKAEE